MSRTRQSNNSGEHTERAVRLLFVSPWEEDRAFFRRFFAHTNWRLHVTETSREAAVLLRRHRVGVIVTERLLGGEDWRSLLPVAEACPVPPLIVVIYRLSEADWASEAVEAGAYDILAKPFQDAEVSQVISFAWLQWMRRRGEARPAA